MTAEHRPGMGGKGDAIVSIAQNGTQYNDSDIDDLLAEAIIAEENRRHPLDITPVTDLELGWIDSFTNLFTDLNGSPRPFNELTAIVAVAAAIQRKAYLPLSFDNIFPNVYAAIVAQSTVYRKTTTIKRARSILYYASLSHLQFSENFTSEGLINGLADSPSVMIVRDEIGTLLGSHKVKYQQMLIQDLTALYDCGPYSRKLAGAEATVDEPYINILGATTPTRFFHEVQHSDWEDGFLVRWLLVTPESEPNFDHSTEVLSLEQDSAIRKLGEWLGKAVDRGRTAFEIDAEALALWDRWQKNNLRTAYEFQSGVVTSLVGRYNTYALKFALIIAVARGQWGHIDVDTMQTAMHLANNFKVHVHRLMQQKDERRVTGGKLQKILGVIFSRNQKQNGPVPISEIYRYANLRKDEVEPVVEELVERGAVIAETSANTPRYLAVADRLKIRSV